LSTKVEAIRNRKRVFLAWLLFLVTPLISYVVALRSFKKTWAKNIVWAFTAFFGYTMQISANFAGDAAVYRSHFLDAYSLHTTVADLFSNFFVNSDHIEIMSDLLGVLVSGYTNNYHFLFLVYGVFFGFFFSRNLDYMYQRAGGNLRSASIWITVALSFVVPMWNISGFDFWTASHVYIYAMLPLLCEGSYRRLPFLFLSPLIHFSFYLLIMMTLSFIVAQRFKGPIIAFYVLSFFVFGIHPDEYSDVAGDYLPAIIYSRMQVYLNNASKVPTASGGTIVVAVNLLYKFALSAIFLMAYNANKIFIERHKYLNRIFLFAFYFTGIFNILSIIPSVGRFITVMQAFMWVGLFILLNHPDFKNFRQVTNLVNKIKIVLIIFWSITILRYLFPMLGIGSILSGPFWVNNFIDNDTVIGNVLEFLNN